jgi:septal ring factor EnvC (AmiA/AmiB activator)
LIYLNNINLFQNRFKMSSVTVANMNSVTQDSIQVKEIEKYYNDIIENLRLNLQVAENRIRRLQDSEFKLESEIEDLKEQLSQIKNN